MVKKLLTKFAISCLACTLLAFAGCGENSPSGFASNSSAPPKLDFHKPRNFSLAIERLRKIHDGLATADEVPQPITYTVFEEFHDHGGNPHLHYRLLTMTGLEKESCNCGQDHDHDAHDHDDHDHGDHDHDDHDHRDPFDAGPPQHTIVVDAFTELADIARWLPAIAADGDMSADEWKKVKSITSDISSELDSIAGEPGEKLSAYKSKAKAIGASVEQLEALVKPNAAKIL